MSWAPEYAALSEEDQRLLLIIALGPPEGVPARLFPRALGRPVEAVTAQIEGLRRRGALSETESGGLESPLYLPDARDALSPEVEAFLSASLGVALVEAIDAIEEQGPARLRDWRGLRPFVEAWELPVAAAGDTVASALLFHLASTCAELDEEAAAAGWPSPDAGRRPALARELAHQLRHRCPIAGIAPYWSRALEAAVEALPPGDATPRAQALLAERVDVHHLWLEAEPGSPRPRIGLARARRDQAERLSGADRRAAAQAGLTALEPLLAAGATEPGLFTITRRLQRMATRD